eukprot:TRINITY_DN27719_c0_g1_i1.p2 TRINITY_DN27719_c0_g1~~TRINITY_DN27719_c0_g1_i1.p2  ORF type:complete len:106 (-),score=5.43 TRINITY_DN27719_c0_g1_i1:129-446(-)
MLSLWRKTLPPGGPICSSSNTSRAKDGQSQPRLVVFTNVPDKKQPAFHTTGARGGAPEVTALPVPCIMLHVFKWTPFQVTKTPSTGGRQTDGTVTTQGPELWATQ